MGDNFLISFQKSLQKLTLLVLLLTITVSVSVAQARESGTVPRPRIEKSGFDWDRVVVGGGIGASFGTITNLNISPSIAYKITDNWLAGISTRYIYFEDRRFNPPFKTNIYGGGPFTQFFFLENFLLHGEYELLSLEDFNSFNLNDRITIQSCFVGGGYRSAIGSNSFASFLILWDIIQDPNSPYINPVLRLNFGFGL